MTTNNIQFIKLYNGTIQTYNKDENRISEVAFDTYDLNLLPYGKKENTHIYADELPTSQILKNLKNKKPIIYSAYEKEQFAELHTRIINPFYIFFFSFLPLLMVGFSKRPDDSWAYPIITVSMIAFSVQILQITVSNLLIENISLAPLNYALPFTLIAIVLICLSYNFSNL